MYSSIGILQGCLIMTVLVTSKAYHYADSYSVTDDIDEDEEENSEESPQREDYSKYFSGSGNVAAPHTAETSATDTSTGFVQPLDFSHLFTGSNFGMPETVRGVIAPPSASNIFAIQASPVLSGLIPGFIPRVATSATNNINHSSHIGFINPNPSVELQALFNTALAPTVSAYQKHPFMNQYAQPAAIISSQPISSYSMFLPNFGNTKSSVIKEVENGQRQASQKKYKKSPSEKTDNEEYDTEEGENDDEDDEDEDDDYMYEEPEKRTQSQASSSQQRTSKSNLQKKPRNDKKNTIKYPYPYDLSKTFMPKTSSSNNKKYVKQKPQKKKISHDADYYSSLFDYPETNIDEPLTKIHNEKARQPVGKFTNHRSVSALNNKSGLSKSNNLRNVKNSYSSLTNLQNEPTLPTYVLGRANSQFSVNKQPVKSIYPYNSTPLSPVSLQTGFIPSASIPFAENYPQPSVVPYSSLSPVSPLPSSLVPENPLVKSHSSDIARNTKRCTKIEKQPENDSGKPTSQTMICYKCHDVVTGANYEQCSYDSQTKTKPFFETDFESIKATKTITQPSTRSKRATSDLPYDVSFSHDMNVGQSVTLVRKVRQYTEYDDSSQTFETPYSTEEHDNYRFGPEHFTDIGKSSEEADATQEVSESSGSEQCRKIKKKGIICMVCEKPSGGFYEQCLYASDPKENSYSYGSSKTYGHGSASPGKRNRRFTDLFSFIKESVNTKPTFKRNVRNEDKKNEKYKNGRRKFDEYDEEEENPENFSESVARINKANNKGKLVGLDPFFYGSSDETMHQEEGDDFQKTEEDGNESDEEKSETAQKPATYDDYFARLFPEFETEGTERKSKRVNQKEEYDYGNPEEDIEDVGEVESRNAKKKVVPDFGYKSTIPDYFDDTEQRKDLEMVLGEFKQKDRSSCKKVMRDKMTCYLCMDDKGLQHEECMFVAASEPKNKQLAYHEVKQFRIAPTTSSLNTVESKAPKKKTILFNDKGNPKHKMTIDNNRIKNRQRSVTAASDINESSNPLPVNDDNDSHAAENIDTSKLHSSGHDMFPMSTITIQNQRYFSKKVSPNVDLSSRTKESPVDEYLVSESRHEYQRKRHNTDKENIPTESSSIKTKQPKETSTHTPYEAVPPDPPKFDEREGPEGAFSEDTEPAFDTVLQITLPKYMLDKSEHEKEFDEILASG